MCDGISWDPAHHKALCNHPSVSSSILKQLNSCGIEADQAHRVISQAAGGTSRSSRRSLFRPCAGGADCYSLSWFSTCFILLSLKTFLSGSIDSEVQNKHQSDSDSDSARSPPTFTQAALPERPLGGSSRTRRASPARPGERWRCPRQTRWASSRGAFSLLNLLLASVYPAKAPPGLQSPLRAVSENTNCSIRSPERRRLSHPGAGDVLENPVWVRLRRGPAPLTEKIHLERKLKLRTSLPLAMLIRLYQQRLEQAGIYCQRARTNNLISHWLKNGPHLSRLCSWIWPSAVPRSLCFLKPCLSFWVCLKCKLCYFKFVTTSGVAAILYNTTRFLTKCHGVTPSAQSDNALRVRQHLRGCSSPLRSRPVGWQCGQLTPGSVPYFSAICVPSLCSKRKDTCAVRALPTVWASLPKMKMLMIVTFLGIQTETDLQSTEQELFLFFLLLVSYN